MIIMEAPRAGSPRSTAAGKHVGAAGRGCSFRSEMFWATMPWDGFWAETTQHKTPTSRPAESLFIPGLLSTEFPSDLKNGKHDATEASRDHRDGQRRRAAPRHIRQRWASPGLRAQSSLCCAG